MRGRKITTEAFHWISRTSVIVGAALRRQDHFGPASTLRFADAGWMALDAWRRLGLTRYAFWTNLRYQSFVEWVVRVAVVRRFLQKTEPPDCTSTRKWQDVGAGS